jgi:hypothetical protein
MTTIPATRSGRLEYTEGSWRFKVHKEIWFNLSDIDTFPNNNPPAILSGLACINQPGGGIQKLHIMPGYAWDGASGPAIDTTNFRNGSLVHDVLYQMMRQGAIPRTEKNRETADQILRRICREDGMSTVRAGWVYWAVQTFAKRASTKEAKPTVHEAP